MSKMFTVYKGGDPKKPEKHTRPNASDLVNGAGYTWEPNRKATPAALSPHRVLTPPTPKEPAQAVLDAHGHNAERAVAFDPAVVEETYGEPEVDEQGEDTGIADIEDADDGDGTMDGAEAPAEVEAEVTAPKPRGRPRKAV